MTSSYMADELVRFVDSNGGSLMHQLVDHVEGSGVGTLHFIEWSPKVVLWTNVSEKFVEAFSLAYPRLEMRRCNPLMYAAFADEWPSLPIVTSAEFATRPVYDSLHWLPAVFFRSTVA